MNKIEKFFAIAIMVILFEVNKEKPKKQDLDHLERYVRTNFLFNKKAIPYKRSRPLLSLQLQIREKKNTVKTRKTKLRL